MINQRAEIDFSKNLGNTHNHLRRELSTLTCACALVSWGSGNGQCRSIFVYVLFGEQHYHRKLSRYIDSSGESTDPIPLGTHTHTHTPTLRRSRS